MDKKTYKALKRIIKKTKSFVEIDYDDWKRIQGWIDEVAKEYEE